MAAVFPWARKSRFRIMIVDTTLAVSGLPRPVCAPPVETKPERRRTHPRRVPVVYDRLVHLEGIVKLRLKAVSDAQHGGFATGLSPVSWGSIDELFVNLTIPVNGVVSEAVPIVAIGMATRNAEDPLAQQIRQRMPDLAGLPVVDQTLGEPVDQPVLSLCRLQQDGAAIGARMLLIERRDEGLVEEIREENSL